jgi:cytochrome P450
MTIQYDPFSEEVMQDPYPIYEKLREEAPCYHLKKWDAYALSRFEDIWAASMDAKNYSTARGTTAAHLLTKVQPVTPMLNLMDPPSHTKLRSQIRKYFTPGRVNSLEPQIQRIVDDAFEPIRGAGSTDLYLDVASKISVKVACLANGFPMEDADQLNALVWRFFAREEGVEGMTQDGLAAMGEMTVYFADLIKHRRANPTEEGSAVETALSIEIDGRKFTDEEAGSHLSMFLIGGAETFPKVFSSAIYLLYKHPDQRARCAADPSLIPDAFNLRHAHPVPDADDGERRDAPRGDHARGVPRDVPVPVGKPGQARIRESRRLRHRAASAAHPLLRPRHPRLHRRPFRATRRPALARVHAEAHARVRSRGGQASANSHRVRPGLGIHARHLLDRCERRIHESGGSPSS